MDEERKYRTKAIDYGKYLVWFYNIETQEDVRVRQNSLWIALNMALKAVGRQDFIEKRREILDHLKRNKLGKMYGMDLADGWRVCRASVMC